MRNEELKGSAISHNASKAVGAGGFHPKVPLDLSAETCGNVVVFLEKSEAMRFWPGQASTMALLPIRSGWWEWSRALFIQEWKKRSGVKMGCYRRMQWRSRKNSVRSFVGSGKVQVLCGRD